MKHKLFVAILCTFPTMAISQTIDADINFENLNRTEFIDEMHNIQEAMWDDSFVMLTRVDASLEALVPKFTWTDKHVSAYQCLYDDMSDQRSLGEVNLMRDNAIKMIDYLEKNPNLTLFTIEDYPGFQELMTPPPTFIKATIDCKIIALNARAISDSGLFQATQKFYVDKD